MFFILFIYLSGHLGRDSMIVGFSTTCAIGVYHHWSCEFESRSWWGVLIQHYVIKFVSNLQQFGGFFCVLRFPPPIKLTTTIQLKYILKVALNTIKQTNRLIYPIIKACFQAMLFWSACLVVSKLDFLRQSFYSCHRDTPIWMCYP
jgi:hypothetical protein